MSGAAQTIAYTSLARNYLPKAALLAKSFKRFHPSARIVAILIDGHLEKTRDPLLGAFDEVLSIPDLKLPFKDLDSWIFKHDIVELATAVKGAALKLLLNRPGVRRVIYLDPDIFFLGSLNPVINELSRRSIVLTPHLLKPETDREQIGFHECGALKHGVFNLGFLGVRSSPEGRRFADWWSERLLHFCQNDTSRGLFTDQKWIDHVQVFFPDHAVLRDPGLNAARWNFGQRKISRDGRGRFFADGRPLVFFHFSGVDSGEHDWMMDRFAPGNAALRELTALYRNALTMLGDADFRHYRSPLTCYSNGEAITPNQRRLYRSRSDLMKAFPRPREVVTDEPCFLRWFKEDLRSSLQHKLKSLNEGSHASTGVLEDINNFLGLH